MSCVALEAVDGATFIGNGSHKKFLCQVRFALESLCQLAIVVKKEPGQQISTLPIQRRSRICRSLSASP